MRCSVPYCRSEASNRGDISFFQYPKPKNDLLALWIKNCGTEHLAEKLLKKNYLKVCSNHFAGSMFLNSTTKNRLVWNAIPTVFNDEIMSERLRFAKSKLKTHLDPQHFDDSSNELLRLIQGTEELSSHLGYIWDT